MQAAMRGDDPVFIQTSQFGDVREVEGFSPITSEYKAQEARDIAAGKDLGESEVALRGLEASFPAIYEVTGKLKELAPLATYTWGGGVFDQAVRQLGFGETEGATAKARYSSIIKNQILPLLKQTFGAAFTEKEGAKLEETLGNPELAPEAKIAQLEEFLDNKLREIQTEYRKLGQPVPTKEEIMEGAGIETEGAVIDVKTMSDEDLLRGF